MTRIRTLTAFVTSMLLHARLGLALPEIGKPFPYITAEDVTGQAHRTDEYVGRRTLVAVITDRRGADAMKAWFGKSAALSFGIGRLSVPSFGLPFFISTGYARSQVRAAVPSQYWHAMLFDRGDTAKALGLAKSDTPYVYALDEQGRVIAAVHASVTASEAQAIWDALSRGR